MHVASRGPGNVPSVARALGCRVAPDRRRVTVFLSAAQAPEPGRRPARVADGRRGVQRAVDPPDDPDQGRRRDGRRARRRRPRADRGLRGRPGSRLASLGHAEAFGRALLDFDPAGPGGGRVHARARRSSRPRGRVPARRSAHERKRPPLDAIRDCLEGAIPATSPPARPTARPTSATSRRCTTSTPTTSRCRSSSSTRRARTSWRNPRATVLVIHPLTAARYRLELELPAHRDRRPAVREHEGASSPASRRTPAWPACSGCAAPTSTACSRSRRCRGTCCPRRPPRAQPARRGARLRAGDRALRRPGHAARRTLEALRRALRHRARDGADARRAAAGASTRWPAAATAARASARRSRSARA